MLDENTPINGLSKTIVDFWKWAYSDLLMNNHRGVFAEFIVASSLGVEETQRIEWDVADVSFKGHSIEVKSSAFVQSWDQNKLTTPDFDISKKHVFGEYGHSKKRNSDIYVFCLLKEKVYHKVDPLNLE
ncbi:hypothetical protein [Tenuibacillus multivorans]|uniref:hypothetical protein n=1 Tax=Tenuibacillus multivorans TaxID=237069 RepID=UPI000A838918|nr:hypothetical protein [Tenuibacillus multivorans]GEL78740.1 hypothetical protein TMU01_29750 [Tenuibacillus multivorans]